MTDPAIESLRAALAVAPGDVTLHRLLADRLLERDRFDEAIDAYRAALRINDREPALRIGLARSYLAAGRAGAAELVTDDLLSLDPSCAEGHLVRARALLAQSRPDEAAAAYGRAISLDASLVDERLAVQLGFATTPGATPATPAAAPVQPRPQPPAATPEAGVEDGAEDEPAEEAPDVAEPDRDEPDGDGHAYPLGPGRRTESKRAAGPHGDWDDTIEKARISFADVGGMDALKEEIRIKIIYPRQHPELYRAYGKVAGGGILLYGPPGCGKTYLSRATAGELDAAFISVGISDVLNMWIGESEQNLHRVFNVARQHAPCVLFFDEVDALAASRADFKSTAGRALINQFLSELDGADASNEGVLVMGATNAPWHMDPAFRRPGRFDNIVFVPPPDLAARTEILRVLLRERPARDVDPAKIAALTDGYSGADLQGVVERAVEAKLAEALRTGIPKPLTTDDLVRPVKGAAPTTREWFATVRNYVLYSNESGLYDPVRPYLKGR